MEFKQEINSLVSIIIPTYNSASYLEATLNSIVVQSYSNWEAIIIDDCSEDDTKLIVSRFQESDSRIKYLKLEKNSGTAVARNKGVEEASGTYIAFLDSDDMWAKDKLTKQINFMEENNYYFTSTSYSKIDQDGKELGRIVSPLKKMNYYELLKRNTGNSTVIYNAEFLGKFFIPDIRKRNDYVMWLQVIKKAKNIYGLDEVLAMHRVREGSLSKNKFSLLKYHWHVYRKIEHLPLKKSIYLMLYWVLGTSLKTTLNKIR
ncbi:glycosyltransferase family 2 protein [Marinilactibacillus kalidii]|uniref:glycosyltransferase family 2 protein n=1 Tax=Marinilactibacillus kalidii TaxID=2820274 RepID=UPI003134516F